MIKLFCGEDSFESYYAAKKAVKTLAEENSAEVKIIDCDNSTTIEMILNEVESVGMFVEKSVLLIKRVFTAKKILESFTENFGRLDNYDIVIWQDGKVDSRLKLFKLLQKEKGVTKFEEQKAWQTAKWLEDLLKTKDIKLSKTQINFIVERTENNKWLIFNEMKKVKTYLSSNNQSSLTDSELDKIMGLDIKGDLWKFLDYFGNREYDRAVNEYNKLVSFEDLTQYLIAMLSRELSIISQIKYAEENNVNYKELGLHPFVLQKSMSKAKNFSFPDLKNLVDGLLNLDFMIKRGDINSILGLKLFLNGIKKENYFSNFDY